MQKKHIYLGYQHVAMMIAKIEKESEMKRLDLMALLVGAALFTGLGATSATAAMGEKCGAGKCGTKKGMSGNMGSMSFDEKKKKSTQRI